MEPEALNPATKLRATGRHAPLKPSRIKGILLRYRFPFIGSLLLLHGMCGWGKWGMLYQDTAAEYFILPLRVLQGELPGIDFKVTYGVLGYLLDAFLFSPGFPATNTVFIANFLLIGSILAATEFSFRPFLSKVPRTLVMVFILVALAFPGASWRTSSFVFGYCHANIYACAATMGLLWSLKAGLLSGKSSLSPWLLSGTLTTVIFLTKLDYLPAALLGSGLALFGATLRLRSLRPFLCFVLGVAGVIAALWLWYGRSFTPGLLFPDPQFVRSTKELLDQLQYRPTWIVLLRSLFLFTCCWLLALKIRPSRMQAQLRVVQFMAMTIVGYAIYTMYRKGHFIDNSIFISMVLMPFILLCAFLRRLPLLLKGRLSSKNIFLLVIATIAQALLLRSYINGVDVFSPYQILPSIGIIAWFMFRESHQLLRMIRYDHSHWTPGLSTPAFLLLILFGILTSHLAFEYYRSKQIKADTNHGSIYLNPIAYLDAHIEASRWIKELPPNELIYSNSSLISFLGNHLNVGFYEHGLFMYFHPDTSSRSRTFSSEDDRDIRTIQSKGVKTAVLVMIKEDIYPTFPAFGRDYGTKVYDHIRSHFVLVQKKPLSADPHCRSYIEYYRAAANSPSKGN